MLLQHTHQQAVRLLRHAALMGKVSFDDVRTENVTMQQWPGGVARLEPMDILKISQPDFGAPRTIPLTMHSDQDVVGSLHRSSS
jgi:hypothetical protein